MANFSINAVASLLRVQRSDTSLNQPEQEISQDPGLFLDLSEQVADKIGDIESGIIRLGKSQDKTKENISDISRSYKKLQDNYVKIVSNLEEKNSNEKGILAIRKRIARITENRQRQLKALEAEARAEQTRNAAGTIEVPPVFGDIGLPRFRRRRRRRQRQPAPVTVPVPAPAPVQEKVPEQQPAVPVVPPPVVPRDEKEGEGIQFPDLTPAIPFIFEIFKKIFTPPRIAGVEGDNEEAKALLLKLRPDLFGPNAGNIPGTNIESPLVTLQRLEEQSEKRKEQFTEKTGIPSWAINIGVDVLSALAMSKGRGLPGRIPRPTNIIRPTRSRGGPISPSPGGKLTVSPKKPKGKPTTTFGTSVRPNTQGEVMMNKRVTVKGRDGVTRELGVTDVVGSVNKSFGNNRNIKVKKLTKPVKSQSRELKESELTPEELRALNTGTNKSLKEQFRDQQTKMSSGGIIAGEAGNEIVYPLTSSVGRNVMKNLGGGSNMLSTIGPLLSASAGIAKHPAYNDVIGPTVNPIVEPLLAQYNVPTYSTNLGVINASRVSGVSKQKPEKEGGGIFGGIINFFKGLFGGGKDDTVEPSLTPPPPVPSSPSSSSGVSLSGPSAARVGNDTEFLAEVKRVAQKFKIKEGDLLGLMASESGLDPAADNGAYVGLIQFSADSAKLVGTTQAALKKMTRAQQMKYVEKYLDWWQLPEGADAGQIYSVVFAPALASGDPNTVLYRKGEAAYRDNRWLDKNGDGTITVSELGGRIESKKKEFGISDAPEIKSSATSAGPTPEHQGPVIQPSANSATAPSATPMSLALDAATGTSGMVDRPPVIIPVPVPTGNGGGSGAPLVAAVDTSSKEGVSIRDLHNLALG